MVKKQTLIYKTGITPASEALSCGLHSKTFFGKHVPRSPWNAVCYTQWTPSELNTGHYLFCLHSNVIHDNLFLYGGKQTLIIKTGIAPVTPSTHTWFRAQPDIAYGKSVW